MANLKKVMLIGRLTRDPEVRTFSNGGKVAKFGFAVNNRKKNTQSGQWEDVPVFLDVEVFNRGDFGKQADLVEQSLRKGKQVFLEGHLRMDTWDGQDGQKRSKLMVVVDNFQYLEPKDGYSSGGSSATRASSSARQPDSNGPSANGADYYEEPAHVDPPAERDQEIPF
jgi:single-strand DNA-binding protein